MPNINKPMRHLLVCKKCGEVYEKVEASSTCPNCPVVEVEVEVAVVEVENSIASEEVVIDEDTITIPEETLTGAASDPEPITESSKSSKPSKKAKKAK